MTPPSIWRRHSDRTGPRLEQLAEVAPDSTAAGPADPAAAAEHPYSPPSRTELSCASR